MRMSGFSPSESNHVAQQSRRDKLREQHASDLSYHPHFDANPPRNNSPADIVQVRHVRNANNMLFDPTPMFFPELLNFSINANHAFASSAQDLGEEAPQNYGNWRSLNPPQNFDNWDTNYPNGTCSNHHMINSSTPSHLKPSNFQGFQYFSSPPPIYHNTLQDFVALASTEGSQHDQQEKASCPQGSLMNQSVIDDSSSWMDRPIRTSRHNWNSVEELRSTTNDYSNQQGLSLSLSSNPPPSQGLQAKSANRKPSGYLSSVVKPSIISKACGATKSLQDMVDTTGTAPSPSNAAAYHRSTAPLGPFTGYATILESSKYLKPAYQLLEEFCRVSDRSKALAPSERKYGDQASVSASASVSVSNDQAANMTPNTGRNNSAASSSTFYGMNEISSDGGATTAAAASTSSGSVLPEYQQKKEKLLYMQEEVCRKYKQYHQQMEMVVSSFASVSGLSTATPYISLAVDTVSRDFKCLTVSIKDQLKHIRKALGEDFSSAKVASTNGGNSNSDKTVGKLKYMGLGLQKHKAGGGLDAGFSDPEQHIWRPQRGLPDRSVAILRAWLFDHFLHPYPTDTDKCMLASQTGLSRNQVSNWFINARVRVWKPMVEEIHTLETKGSTEARQDPRKDGNSPTEGISRPNNKELIGMHPLHRAISDRQLESSGIGSFRDAPNLEVQQCQEIKRSRLECPVPSSMDSALSGFVPYNQSGLDVGGLRAVSLTLGLRHGVESAQHQQQQQQRHQQLHEPDEYQPHLGGPMIYDFVG